MELFVARQPIFDLKEEIYGYELLYRSGDQNLYTGANGDEASLSVIQNLLLTIGTQKICGGNKAFVNFTRNLLLNGVASLLPKEIGVVEILEDVEPDPELMKALGALHSKGYLLALDDFILRGNENNPFLEFVDIIKVDFRQTDEQERATIARRFSRGGKVKLLAEKTETREEFNQAARMGYSLFQGYFFCKPEIMTGRSIPGYKANYLRVLKELNAESLDYESLQNIISRDPALTFKLLKYINSAHFGLRREVKSIKQALEFLGEYEIKKWATIAVFMELGKDQPMELLRFSLVRARMCEMLAGKLGRDNLKSILFLMGLLSLMDVVLGKPMREILDDIPLASSPKAALVGGHNSFRKVLDLVVSYEKADWTLFSKLASHIGVNPVEISEIYSRSVEWVGDM